MRQLPPIPRLGIGVVWWPELDPLCRPGEGLVQVIEAEPETFWIPSTSNEAGITSRLPGMIGHLPQPKLLHGVGAPFGGMAAQTGAHRMALAGDIAALQPAWISDHLSFDRYDPPHGTGDATTVFTGFFMPPAQCADGVAQAARHIRHRRATTGVPVAFENAVSYLPPLPGEMPDGAFARAVAEAADCGILLDLHNVLCNERNGRQSVSDFCDAIPLDRVWEIHLAGGQSDRGFWLDAHSGLVEPALMDIVADLVPRLPSLGAITFEMMPEFVAAIGLPAIAGMLARLNDIWATRPPATASRKTCPAYATASESIVPAAAWECSLGAAVTGHGAPAWPAGLAEWLRQAESPLDLYRFLAQEWRASSLVVATPVTIRALLRERGEAQTRDLLGRFWRQAPPAYTAAEEGQAFLSFVEASDSAVLATHIATDRCSLSLMCA